MGNAESSTEKKGSAPSHSVAFRPPVQTSEASTDRPLRSILRPASLSHGDVEARRRSVAFADQFDVDSSRFSCQPFLLGQRVTHFGPERPDLRRSTVSLCDADLGQRWKKRAPPVPPLRRDSIGRGSAPAEVTPRAEEVEAIRKKMRLDLQQSRAEYERLRNLRLPLRRPDTGSESGRFRERFRAQFGQNQPSEKETPASSTETLKEVISIPKPLTPLNPMRCELPLNESPQNAATAELTKVLAEFHIGVYDERARRAGKMRERQWSCHSSDSGISNTLGPDTDEHSGYVVIDPVIRSELPAPRLRRRSPPDLRSENDAAPAVRLPQPVSFARGPRAAPPSSEPLFAFGDAPQNFKRSNRHSMNDSFRRMRSSLGRFFGSIGRGHSSGQSKRRPVTMVFDVPPHDFHGNYTPLDAWKTTGSAFDLSTADVPGGKPSAHDILDADLASVWHSVVRSSHEHLHLSNPSLYDDPEVSPEEERRQGILHMSKTPQWRRNFRTFQPNSQVSATQSLKRM